MTQSALDRTCEKYGCAKVWLDPKLHLFDDCFGGKIRMGDVDFAVERRGHILWGEWKRGAVLQAFEKEHAAQFRQAVEFTRNSEKQSFLFILGCPVEMRVDQWRLIHGGRWREGWQAGGVDSLKGFLRRWFYFADTGKKLQKVEPEPDFDAVIATQLEVPF